MSYPAGVGYTVIMADQSSTSPEPHTPTVADATALATAAGEAAASTDNPEAARQATRTAVEQVVEQRNLTLSDDDVTRIVDGLISSLDARGVFDTPPPQSPPAMAAENPSGGEAENPTSPPPPEDPPHKRTFAEKFLGSK